MNILIDVSHLQTKRGGVYAYLSNLLPILEDHVNERGHHLKYLNLYCRSGCGNLPEIPNLCNLINFRFPVKLLNYSWLYLHFPDFSKFYSDFDIVHGTHFSLPIMSNAKKILTIDDITYVKHPEYFDTQGKKLNDYKYKKLLPLNIKRAEIIIAISEFTKRDIIDFYKVPEEKIKVVHHGVAKPTRLTKPELEQTLNQFNLHSHDYIYFPVGTYEHRKNLSKLIDAFLKAMADKSLKLVISGVGNPTYIDSENLDKKIIFLEWNTEKQKNALFQGSLFVVYPSLYEGFGIPIIEAMANGKAVLTSNSTSMIEIATGYAHLINPQDLKNLCDGISLLANNRDYRIDLEKKGLKRAEDFTYRKMARQYFEIYNDVSTD